MSQYDAVSKEYYAMRTKMFRKGANPELAVILDMMGTIKGKTLLDLGCGFGEYARIYAKKGGKVTAVDNSEKLISHAQKLSIEDMTFIKQDISKKLRFKNKQFDVITANLVIDHIKNIDSLFKECNRVLKKKGLMIFTISNPLLYQEKSLVGRIKIFGRKIIFGDYYTRRKIVRKWAKTKMMHYHKPLEDYFSAILNAGFELKAFREPQAKTKKITWHSKNPTFLVFKLEKK